MKIGAGLLAPEHGLRETVRIVTMIGPLKRSAATVAAIVFHLSLPGQAVLAAGWTDVHQINIITYSPEGNLNIWLHDQHNNPDGCEVANGVQLAASSQFFDKQMTLLMLAYTNKNNMDVKFYVSGCNNNENKSKPNVHWIQLDRRN